LDGTQLAKAGSTTNQPVKTYYAIVNVEGRRLGAYVSAENVAGAFKTATERYKMRRPRLRVETIAVQEMAAEYLSGIWRTPAAHAV
jgi:acyl-CoA synthetase (NDP forming)